jgi:hypothetical protein
VEEMHPICLIRKDTSPKRLGESTISVIPNGAYLKHIGDIAQLELKRRLKKHQGDVFHFYTLSYYLRVLQTMHV